MWKIFHNWQKVKNRVISTSCIFMINNFIQFNIFTLFNIFISFNIFIQHLYATFLFYSISYFIQNVYDDSKNQKNMNDDSFMWKWACKNFFIDRVKSFSQLTNNSKSRFRACFRYQTFLNRFSSNYFWKQKWHSFSEHSMKFSIRAIKCDV